jgi:hypothetical protein
LAGAQCVVDGYDQNDLFAQEDVSTDTLLEFYAEFGCPEDSTETISSDFIVESRFLETDEVVPVVQNAEYDYLVRITNIGSQSEVGYRLEKILPHVGPGTVQIVNSVSSVTGVQINSDGSVALPSMDPKQEIVIYLDLQLSQSVCSRSSVQEIYQERGLCQ